MYLNKTIIQNYTDVKMISAGHRNRVFTFFIYDCYNDNLEIRGFYKRKNDVF